MLKWFRKVLHRGALVIESHTTLAERRLHHLALSFAGFVAAGIVGGAALCGAMAGIVILITPRLGLGSSLLIVAGAILIPLGIALLITARTHHREIESTQCSAKQARDQLEDLLTSDDDEDESSKQQPSTKNKTDSIHEMIRAAASDPAMMTSAAFAVVSVIGLGRTLSLLRAASRLISAGAIASQVVASVQDLNEKNDQPGTNGHVPRSQQRHAAD